MGCAKVPGQIPNDVSERILNNVWGTGKDAKRSTKEKFGEMRKEVQESNMLNPEDKNPDIIIPSFKAVVLNGV